MSDSEEENVLPNNVYTFQNESTIFSAKGPNLNMNNMTSFRNNSHAFNMQSDFAMGYAESSGRMNRRETSPMSLMNFPSGPPRNFQASYYSGAASQRSTYGSRAGSPMSVRSIGSNKSAVEIAQAFKFEKFNKHELKLIMEAYNKYIKSHKRKKIEKRRRMRMFLKPLRRKSGYDSGEQGSNSSISSDDCRSTRTGITMFRSFKGFKKTAPSYQSSFDSRSTKTDLTDLRRKATESEMFRDCSDTSRLSNFKNMFPVGPPSVNSQTRADESSVNRNIREVPKVAMHTQKNRFNNIKSGFLLPSQRFNKSTVSLSIMEGNEVSSNKNSNQNSNNVEQAMDIDQEEIFSEVSIRDNARSQSKRSIDSEDCIDNNLMKKRRMEPTTKPVSCEKTKGQLNGSKSDFQFAKPLFPIKKSARPKEKVISKSAQPLSDNIDTNLQQNNNVVCFQNDKEQILEDEEPEITQQSTTEVSMRPSFMKRKLFTQTLDLTERKNTSSDSVSTASPQGNVYSNMTKEKNKARKLVNNQLLLNRDIQDDNNLLDLIHKIVPQEQMNSSCATTAGNKSKNHEMVNKPRKKSIKKNIPDTEDKWDITSIITTCDDDNVSDTFTDEEIFESTDITLQNKNKSMSMDLNALSSTIKEKSIAGMVSNVLNKENTQENGKNNNKTNETNGENVEVVKNTQENNSLSKEKSSTKNIEKTNTKKLTNTVKTKCSLSDKKYNNDNKVKTKNKNSARENTSKLNNNNDNKDRTKNKDSATENTTKLNNNNDNKDRTKNKDSATENTTKLNNNNDNKDRTKNKDSVTENTTKVNDCIKDKSIVPNREVLNKTNIKLCRVKLNPISNNTLVNNQASTAINGGNAKLNMKRCVESFWDTDIESDMECSANKLSRISNENTNSCQQKVSSTSAQKNNESVTDTTVRADINSVPTYISDKNNTTCNKQSALESQPSKTTKEDNITNPKSSRTLQRPRIILGDLSSSIQSENNSSINSTWDEKPRNRTIKNPNLKNMSNKTKNCVVQEKPVLEKKKKGLNSKKSPTKKTKQPLKEINSSSTTDKRKKPKYNTKKINFPNTNDTQNMNQSVRSLRSRDIDLSSSSEKIKENKKTSKKNTGSKKDLNQSNENSALSNFSLSLETPLNKRLGLRNKSTVGNKKDNSHRLSDLSFTLRSSKKSPMQNLITARSKRGQSGRISRRL